VLTTSQITQWSVDHPWATPDQIEQDYLLSKSLIAIANDEHLGQELVFRGGTALHKLHLPKPLRYSEDLDYVRTTAGGIGKVSNALHDLGQSLGFQVSYRSGEHPKFLWKYVSNSGNPAKIKIEINTHERSPAMPLITIPHSLRTPSRLVAEGNVLTFCLAELTSTKIRALYQRNKGRDLFDMWLSLTETKVKPDDILSAFDTYRPDNFTKEKAIANLKDKLSNPRFLHDLDELTVQLSIDYDIHEAADMVIDVLLSKL